MSLRGAALSRRGARRSFTESNQPPRGPPVIIDCHVHLYGFAEGDPATLAERRDRLLATMAANGIDRAVLLTSHFADDDPSAEETLEAIGDDPRFAVVAGVDCRGGVPANLDRLGGLLRERRIRGLKLYPGYQPFSPADVALHPVYALAGEHGVPVMIHTGDTFYPDARLKHTHPLLVDEVAAAFRDVTLVLCHAGNPWFADAMAVLYKNQNVMADVSGLTLGAFQPRYAELMRTRLGEVIAYLDGPDKLMFGTDWPISDVGGYLAFVESLPMTGPEREGMMWRNADRIFGLGLGG